jgi:hypothetical protein
MPNPSELGPEFDHLIDVLELVAQASGGYVSYDATIRGRKSGDISQVDAAVYIPSANDREDLFVVECHEATKAAGVGVVEDAAAKAQNTGAVRTLAVSSAGFSRPARKRAELLQVDLVTLEEPTTIDWPLWIKNRSFQSGDLGWRILGITVPPAPGIPGNAFRPEVGREDALFENPTGRRFTANELFQRWLRIPENSDNLMDEADRADGAVRKKTVLLAFDRPMKLLGTTVRKLPSLGAANFEIEFWANKQVIPVSLMVAPDDDDPWNSEVALVSGAVNHEGQLKRVVMTLDYDEESGERHVTSDVIVQAPPGAAAAANDNDDRDGDEEPEEAGSSDDAEEDGG